MSATPAMIAPVPASPDFAAELWISLVSLLQSHVAMHSVARPALGLRISTGDRSTTILGPRGKLIVTGPEVNGSGSLEFRPESGELGDEYSIFFFTVEGLVWSGNSELPVDMEAAAEQWLGKVQA